jgi:hypothetical protein
MFRLLDRIWFTMQDKLKGYESGYIDGFRSGIDVHQGVIEMQLRDHDLHHANPEFQLGYAHAVAIVKGEIK